MNNNEFQKPASGAGRKIFLVVLFLLVLGAFGYDYLVAKPAYEGGLKKLQSMLDPKKGPDGEMILVDGKTSKCGDMDGDGRVTPDDVHKFMERDPSATSTPMETAYVETFAWPRGIPFISYKAYVVYSKGAEATTLYKVTQTEPTEDDYRQKYTQVPAEDRPPGLRVSGGGAGGAPRDKGGADKGGADKGGADKGGADKGDADKGDGNPPADQKSGDDADSSESGG